MILTAALSISVAACANGQGPEAGAGSASGPTATSGATGGTAASGPTVTGASEATGATASTGATGPTAGGVSPAPELEDGRHFGFVQSVDPAGASMVFDLAYFLTGEEANQASEAHGGENPVPNDYYIVNDNPRLRTLSLSPDLRVLLVDWDHCCDRFVRIDLEDFAAAIAAEDPVTIDGRLFYGSLSPFWLTVQGGLVTKIEEQYLP